MCRHPESGASNLSTLLDRQFSKHKMTFPVGIRVLKPDARQPVAAVARVLSDPIRGVAR